MIHRRLTRRGAIGTLGTLGAASAVLARGVPAFAAQATPAAAAAATSGGDGYLHPEWLADPVWLAAHLKDANLRVVAFEHPDEFAAGHIPGAIPIDQPDFELLDTTTQASVDAWEAGIMAKLTAAGLSPEQTVVAYDSGTLYAARFWWILKQLGHKDVRVLDGGFPGWVKANLRVTTDATAVKPAAAPYAGVPDPARLATLEMTKAAVEDGGTIIIDARRPDEYEAGHLPGAINIPFTDNGTASEPKVWKPASELRDLYGKIGIDMQPGQPIITYCTTGVRSAVTDFTLLLLGNPDVRLFTGSWVEWTAHPDLPVVTGPNPT